MTDEAQVETAAPAAPVSIDFRQLERLITIKDVAELFEVEKRIVYREARKGLIPGGVKILGKMGFDPDEVMSWVPPEGGERVSKREDGRSRYRIFLTAEEAATLLSQDYEVVDPRIAAKARRAARKAKAAAGGEEAAPAVEAGTGKNPFEDFEA